ncbi:MAG: hypothetical protein DMF81_17000 [Acidobacteria bacterium]|nr:MAG: hypothetical protein DMF81_17000 [Acidobacteriota bacterium]
MVDGDDGYGDAENVAYTVSGYEALGVQALFIEDQLLILARTDPLMPEGLDSALPEALPQASIATALDGRPVRPYITYQLCN